MRGGEERAWMTKAATDETFSSQEKEKLGLPAVGPDTGSGGGTNDVARPEAGGPRGSGGGSTDDPPPRVRTSGERELSSSGDATADEATTKVGGDPHGDYEQLHGSDQQPVAKTAESSAEEHARAESSERSVSGSTCSNGPPREGRESVLEEGSATDRAARVPARKNGDIEGEAVLLGTEGK